MTLTTQDWLTMHMGCALIDAHMPNLDLRGAFLPQWEVIELDAHTVVVRYLPAGERDKDNPGALIYEMIACARADYVRDFKAWETEWRQ